MKSLNVRFDKPHAPLSEDYIVFPRTALDRIEGSVSVENSLKAEAWESALRGSFEEQIGLYRKRFPILYWSLNNLFFWRYKSIFRSLSGLRRLVSTGHYEQVVVHGNVEPAYQVVTNKGEESRAILYVPSVEFPYFLQQGLNDVCSVEVRGALSAWAFARLTHFGRAALVFAVKFALLLRQTLRLRRVQRRVPGPVDVLFVARSIGSADLFRKYEAVLAERGLKAAIMVDLSLHQSWPTNARSEVYQASEFSTVPGLMKTALQILVSCVVARNLPLKLSNGEFELNDNAGAYLRELLFSSIDMQIHGRRIERFLELSGAKWVISGEAISPYIFAQEAAARNRGAKFLRIQTIQFTPNDAVDFNFSDGVIVESESLRDELVRQFPESVNKIRYLGDIGCVESPQHRLAMSPIVLAYFTQPHDVDNGLLLLKSLLAFVESREGEVELRIKPHPRDTVDYSRYSRAKVYDRTASVESCLDEATLAISRSSAVLGEALNLGVPYVACQLAPADRYLEAKFVSELMGATLQSVEGLDSLLRDLPNYLDRYYRNRARAAQTLFKPFNNSEFADIFTS